MANYTNITAEDMSLFLEAQGFNPLTLPGTVELVWGRRCDTNGLYLSLRCYSGIDPSGQSREVGADAIRLVLMLGKPDGTVVKLSGDRRVNRVAGWQRNLQARIDKWTELLPQAKCPKCGLPMVPRKGPHGDFLGCCNYPICTGKGAR